MFHSAALNTYRVIEEDAQALAQYLNDTLEEYEIESTDYILTADGNPTNTAAAGILEKPIIWCCCHRLALVVEGTFFLAFFFSIIKILFFFSENSMQMVYNPSLRI